MMVMTEMTPACTSRHRSDALPVKVSGSGWPLELMLATNQRSIIQDRYDLNDRRMIEMIDAAEAGVDCSSASATNTYQMSPAGR